MNSAITTIFLILSLSMTQVDKPIYFGSSRKPVLIENGVLQGNVEASKDLPQGFYGKWNVTSTLIDTNNPYIFNKKGSDIWEFEKYKGVITLSNPSSGAIASITVNEVNGFTAKFTRKSETGKMKEYEFPTITLNGDGFTGTDMLIFETYSRNGQLIKRDIVKYYIEGKKISGPTLKNIFSQY